MKLSSSIFAAIALLTATPAGAAVFAHYSFDTDFTDGSGNGRDGTLTDVGTAGNSGVTSAAGEHVFGGGAMSFNSDRDYIAVPSTTFGTGTAYTIAFWAKKTAGDTGDSAKWDMAIGQRDSTIFFIGLNDASGITWRSNNAATGTRQVDFTSPDDTAWHHYTISADDSKNLSFYLDGSHVQTVANVETGFIYDTIGEAYTTGRDFDMHGQIDEVWIYDEALDATQISNLKNTNTLVPEPSSALCLLVGGLALSMRRRRKA